MVDHLHPEFHAEVLNGRVLTSRLRPDSFEATSQARRKYDFFSRIFNLSTCSRDLTLNATVDVAPQPTRAPLASLQRIRFEKRH
jgi:hypothetical protein